MISIIASLVILLELTLLYIKGLSFFFSIESVVILWIIWIMAIPSVLSYHKAKLEKQKMLDILGSLAVIIAGIGLVFVTMDKFIGLELILLGYTFEPLAGIPIFLAIKNVKFLWASLFFWGAVIFTAGLPLYLFNLGIIAILGDIVKMIGLFGLLSTFNPKTFIYKSE
ncbi:hypothetical protein [Acidianus sulfidivorans]|nr:hypothetical protein [Acidianus sulfidivorans]